MAEQKLRDIAPLDASELDAIAGGAGANPTASSEELLLRNEEHGQKLSSREQGQKAR